MGGSDGVGKDWGDMHMRDRLHTCKALVFIFIFFSDERGSTTPAFPLLGFNENNMTKFPYEAYFSIMNLH